MTCRKITASVSRRELNGQIIGQPELIGSVERGGPIADGVYVGGVRNTNRFQDVLESLRHQHNPEHWASFALDGDLAEDRGQFPLNHAAGWQWVNVGGRKAVKFDGSVNCGLMYGTDEDFTWVTYDRVVTVGAWTINPTPGSWSIIGTAPNAATIQNGFNLFNSSTTWYFDYTPVISYQRFSCQNAGIAKTPVFCVWQLDGIQSIPYLDGRERNRQAITGDPRPGHTYQPITIGGRSPATIWNAFCTDKLLSAQEIYQLYVAGLNDIQTF